MKTIFIGVRSVIRTDWKDARMPQSAEFGRYFRELHAGENQEEAAKKIKISQSYVSRMDKGWVPSLGVLEKVALAYGIGFDEIREAAGKVDEAAEQAAFADRVAEQAAQKVVEKLRFGQNRSPQQARWARLGALADFFTGRGYKVPPVGAALRGGSAKLTDEDVDAEVEDYLDRIREDNPGKPFDQDHREAPE